MALGALNENKGRVKEKVMQVPMQISFRNMDPSPSVEAVVREKAAKLDRTGISTRASCTRCASISACLARMCT
jgi:hypothetical protein